jgi:hemolysin activation/secretion protein
MTVIYAPPGTALKGVQGAASTLDYGQGSSMEYSLEVENTFKTANTMSYQMSVEVPFDYWTGTFGGGISGSFSQSTENTSSLDAKKSVSFDLKVPGGSSSDGVNHDYDEIWL